MLNVSLLPHPTSPEPAVAGIGVTIERTTAAQLQLQYRLEGALDALCVDDFAVLRRADRLWEHTCFELFTQVPGRTAYCELNFATSGAWAAYRFSAYRTGMEPLAQVSPQVRLRREGSTLLLQASLSLADLEPSYASTALQLAASAVIENRRGHRSYWAARHALGKPDFHHADAFAIALPVA
ncbi:MAG: DOMON-like domain-containing protein [Steroidobacteraceae bacterium]